MRGTHEYTYLGSQKPWRHVFHEAFPPTCIRAYFARCEPAVERAITHSACTKECAYCVAQALSEVSYELWQHFWLSQLIERQPSLIFFKATRRPQCRCEKGIGEPAEFIKIHSISMKLLVLQLCRNPPCTASKIGILSYPPSKVHERLLR